MAFPLLIIIPTNLTQNNWRHIMSKDLNDKFMDIAQASKQGVEKWLKDNSPEKVQKDVMETLDEAKDTIIPKLLGMDNNWGGNWEVDHCNGRAGESAIGDRLKTLRRDAVTAWLDSVPFPEMTPEQQQGLLEEYTKAYNREFYKLITDKAENDAKKAVETISEELKQQLGDISDNLVSVISMLNSK